MLAWNSVAIPCSEKQHIKTSLLETSAVRGVREEAVFYIKQLLHYALVFFNTMQCLTSKKYLGLK